MKFEDMSQEAQEVGRDMILSCIEAGFQMGMFEGFSVDGTKEQFRIELEKFCGFKED